MSRQHGSGAGSSGSLRGVRHEGAGPACERAGRLLEPYRRPGRSLLPRVAQGGPLPQLPGVRGRRPEIPRCSVPHGVSRRVDGTAYQPHRGDRHRSPERADLPIGRGMAGPAGPGIAGGDYPAPSPPHSPPHRAAGRSGQHPRRAVPLRASGRPARDRIRGQGSGVRSQRSEVRGQRSRVRGQRSGVRSRRLGTVSAGWSWCSAIVIAGSFRWTRSIRCTVSRQAS